MQIFKLTLAFLEHQKRKRISNKNNNKKLNRFIEVVDFGKNSFYCLVTKVKESLLNKLLAVL